MLSSFLGMMNNKDQSLFHVGDMLRELFDMCVSVVEVLQPRIK